MPLSRRTEGVRRLRFGTQIARHYLRLRFEAQIACQCLRSGLDVRVAAPTPRQVKRRGIFPLLQLCCVELGCRQCTVADVALIQTLLPCVSRSIATTIRQLGIASVAFRFLRDISVPSPHLHAARVKRRACQCFAADDTLHLGVVVSGPASADAMCFA